MILRSLSLMLGLLVLAGLTACGTAGVSSTASSPARADTNAAPVTYTRIETQDILRRPLASDMVELVYSARQRAIFVSAPDWEDEARSAVLRLDPDTLEVQARIPLDGKGFGLALDDAGDRLYITQGFNGAITAVDTAGNRVIKRIPVMEKVNFAQAYAARGLSAPRTAFLLEQLKKFGVTEDFPYKLREMAIDTRHGRLFAPGLGLGFDSVLFVIDARTLELEKIIPGLGYNAVGIALDEAGGRVFVSNMQGQVMIIDTQTLEITQTLEVQADQLLNLVYDAQANRLFGVDQGIDRDAWRDNHLEREYRHRSPGHRVFALAADTGRTLADMPTSEVPIALRYDDRRQRLYVTNRGGVRPEKGAGSITVYDTIGQQLLQTIPMPPHPNSLSLDEDRNVLYVTVKNDGEHKKAGEQESVARIMIP